MNRTNESVVRQLARLQDMSVTEMKEKFFELYGFETKQKNVANLRSRITYRIQELFLGGLPPEACQELDDIANQDSMANLNRSPVRNNSYLEGTRLYRDWKGVRHEVVIQEDGTIIYNGRSFRSLSMVARLITGTRWNGKIFFGIKKD